MKLDRRLVNWAGFLACAAMMGYALYAERVLGFEPCPLCMFQRVGVVILGVWRVLAFMRPCWRSRRLSRCMCRVVMSTFKACRLAVCPRVVRALIT